MADAGAMAMTAARVLALILACLPCAPARAQAVPAPARDLAADAADMRRTGAAMLLLFSRDDCLWCERVRRAHLAPLARDPAWRTRILLRRIDLDRDTPLTDFSGQRTGHRAFAAARGVRLAPTVILVGPDGRVRGDPLVGVSSVDFYGAYLERALEAALAPQPGATPAD